MEDIGHKAQILQTRMQLILLQSDSYVLKKLRVIEKLRYKTMKRFSLHRILIVLCVQFPHARSGYIQNTRVLKTVP
jgi:hypothetical protein